jgi:hypothetical protein
MTKVELLDDLFSVDWDLEDPDTCQCLVLLTQAILRDDTVSLYDSEEFLDILRDSFSEDHPVWDHTTC